MAEKPPKVFLKILSWFCHPDLLAPIEGDLYELYHEHLQTLGRRKANLLFMKEVISLMRRSLIRPIEGTGKFNRYGMFKNYLTVAFRHLSKNKKYATINIIGLIIGISSSFILLKYVAYFTSSDQEHTHKTRVFEVAQAKTQSQTTAPFKKGTFFGFGPYAKDNYPEITKASRYITNVESRVLYEQPDGDIIKYNEPGIAEVDPDFIRMFSFDFVLGNPQDALDQPNSVIITESTSLRYFKGANPLGKFLKTTAPWGTEYSLNITGVIRDLPNNSRFKFDFLKSLYQKPNEKEEDWSIATFSTFIFIQSPDKAEPLAISLSKDLSTMEILSEKGPYQVQLTSLSTIELSSAQQLILLTGILILIISWTNFANLFTAKSLSRSKEMAMRKVNGSSAFDTFYQFAIESLVIHCLALLGALGLTLALYPPFQSLAQGELLPFYEGDVYMILSFVLFILLGALAAALYPALIINKSKPLKILKNQTHSGSKHGLKLPVILQFILSAVLIISAGVIKNQLEYLQDKQLGFKSDHVLVISPSKDLWDNKMERFQAFQNQIRGFAEVESTSSATSIPGRGGNGEFMTKLEGNDEEHEITIMGVGASFFETMNLQVAAGTVYQRGRFYKNKRSVLVNEAAVKAFGFQSNEEIIGKKIKTRAAGAEKYLEVSGVVTNFHFNSLKTEISPLLLNFNPFRGHVLINLNPATYDRYENLNVTIEKVEKAWNEVYNNQVFDIQFLDDEFDRQYQTEISLRKIFTVFTFVSIFLSSLGLIGLSMFATLKRKSEVGVRKVLGASVWNILALFSRDFMKQIVIAILLSMPIAYYLMDHWLQSYSYRTDMTVWSFILPGVVLLLIGLLTVMSETLKSARSNPVQVLRDE